MVVAQIDKKKISVVALTVNPAGQPYQLTDLFGAQRRTMMSAIEMHFEITLWLLIMRMRFRVVTPFVKASRGGYEQSCLSIH
jgi:hypothetical protein